MEPGPAGCHARERVIVPRGRGWTPSVTRLAASLFGLLVAAADADAQSRPATEFAQVVTLQQAAQAGLVTLTAKGGFSGDVVAVDLEGARVPGTPVRITVRIEFFGTGPDGQSWPVTKVAGIEQTVEQRLAGLRGSDGTEVSVDLEVRVRPGTEPRTGTGFHQIELFDWEPGSQSNWSKPVGGGERVGEWGANEPVGRWAHEVLHLMGLPDRYLAREPVLVVDGVKYPLPSYDGDGSTASINAWWDTVLQAVEQLEAQLGKKGDVQPSIPPGREDDIMADPLAPNAHVFTEDVDFFIGQAGVLLRAPPGELLLNKHGVAQNFGSGASFELFAPRGQTVHVDGLYAYCLDFHRRIPDEGQRFDVLGPAGALPEPQMVALQRVLEEIGRRQDPTSTALPANAQRAVWAVTDPGTVRLSVDDPLPLLDAAGVTFDPTLFAATPHFTDPNAAGATTAAVTTTGVLPPLPAIRGPAPGGPAGSDPGALSRLFLVALGEVLFAPRRLHTVTLFVVVEGGPDQLAVQLERRRRKRGRVVASLPPLGVHAGLTSSVLQLPKLKKGRYVLRVRGQVDEQTVDFAVGRKRRR
jgi:hypothetical protein